METNISFTAILTVTIFSVLSIGIPIFLEIRETRLHKKRIESYAESCGKLFESIAIISLSAFREVSKRKTNKRTK